MAYVQAGLGRHACALSIQAAFGKDGGGSQGQESEQRSELHFDARIESGRG